MPKTVEFSKFIEGKVRTWFKMNNMKKDGAMSKVDLSEMGDIFIKEFNPSDDKCNELKKWLTNGWQILIQEGRRLSDAGEPGGLTDDNAPVLMEIERILESGGRITEDQYVNAYGELIQVNADIFEEHFQKMVGSFFDTFDTDSDGLVTSDDMIRGLKCFGIDQTEAVKMIFDELDNSKCGKVAREHYIAAWVEFMIGEDKNGSIAKFLCRS